MSTRTVIHKDARFLPDRHDTAVTAIHSLYTPTAAEMEEWPSDKSSHTFSLSIFNDEGESCDVSAYPDADDLEALTQARMLFIQLQDVVQGLVFAADQAVRELEDKMKVATNG